MPVSAIGRDMDTFMPKCGGRRQGNNAAWNRDVKFPAKVRLAGADVRRLKAATGGKDSLPRFFFCPAKRCGKRTADAGRNDDAMRLGPAWASKERFSRPERRILHGGRPYMAWNGHGVQPASSVLTFTAGVHACYHLSDLLT